MNTQNFKAIKENTTQININLVIVKVRAQWKVVNS